MTTKFERHPLGAANIPMQADERADLRASIQRIGVQRPVVLFDGMVLDGWNRYEECLDLGIEPPVTDFTGTWEQARDLVDAEQVHRTMTVEQRLLFRARLDAVLPPASRGAPRTPQIAAKAAEVAEREGVSLRQVKRARAVAKKGGEELQRAVEAGKLSLKRAAEIAQLPQEEQSAAIDAPPPAARRRSTVQAEAPAAEAPAPRRGAAAVPAPAIGPTQEAYDTLRESHGVLVEHVEEMEARLAAHFMEGSDEERAAARILIEELQAKVRTLEVELQAVKTSRDLLMTEKGELMRQCTYYRNQLKTRPLATA